MLVDGTICKYMNLPNYFLADLPPEATLTAAMLTEACQTLKRNRQTYLAHHSTEHMVKVLSEVAVNWLRADYPFRNMALELGPAQTGFSAATLARGLEAFFSELTHENLEVLLVQELGHVQRLDKMVAVGDERSCRRLALARGPEFLVHITAGNVPSPAFMSIVLGLLVRSAQFVKCASGAALLPKLFTHSIYDAEPKLGACLEVAEWSGGNVDLEKVLFDEADCITAAGSDETLAAIRAKLPIKTRFLGYGHRVSFAYVTHDSLHGHHAKKVAAQAASDVAAWNQLGCLSPHIIFVQTGGDVTPKRFAELLADELEQLEASEPRGPLPTGTAAGIASRRAIYEVRAAHALHTRVWQSANSTAWTVIYEEDARFQTSCLNRFIYVKPVCDLTEALQNADEVRGEVSTVGISATGERAQKVATELAGWGATRVCPLGRMQAPPLTWRHDGRPALGDLVTWTDVES
jgi:hypothetical protein